MTVRRPDTPIEWARKACDSLMDAYAAGSLPPAHRWHYHQGVFLCGMELLWEAVQDERYIRYIQEYVDDLVDKRGNFYLPGMSWTPCRRGCCCSGCMNGPERRNTGSRRIS
ncbi:hypothetical protein HMSSN036_78370 [Paenibacillus macerans]|nr:hypothetical protein HMSSN036_78370 [Paenibacillus macerans]